MDKLLEKRIDDLRGLIGKTDPENDALTLDPIAAVKAYFKKKETDFDLQKAILRELPGYSEFEGKEDELKKLRPRDPAICRRDPESIKSYIKNYDASKGYKCKVFATSFNHSTGELYNGGNLVFDRGTMNFIGARTSRGKTTAMVSMAVDALLQGHNVFFATFEETDTQIYTRIVLNLAWREIIEKFPNGANFRSRVEFTPFSPGKIFHSIIRGEKPEYNPFDRNNDGYADEDMEKLTEILKAAEKKADEFFKEQLMIYNGYLAADFQAYQDELENIDPGTVVFADYIQKIPSPAKRAENRYIGLKQLLYDINTVVKKNDLISISGAQFGRTDNKTNPNIKDSFTDESFQESSDIEQIGEIEIGIGREPGKENDGKAENKNAQTGENKGNVQNNAKPKDRMFFSVLKNRQGENNPALEFDLIDGRKFSYFATNLKVEGHY